MYPAYDDDFIVNLMRINISQSHMWKLCFSSGAARHMASKMVGKDENGALA